MLYRVFSSLRTSVYILSLLCLVFLIGTIFPQGENMEDYRKAGGKYVTLVSAMDLLDVFMSPLFLFIIGILLLNLAVCLYDRLKVFLKIKRRPMDLERLRTHPKVITFTRTLPVPSLAEGEQNLSDIEARLAEIGFKPREGAHGTGDSGVRIFEKGLPYWWLSWFYHLGILLAMSGFFLTALFAFEKDVALYPEKPATISLYSRDTRWNEFLRALGRDLQAEGRGDAYTLTLKEFRTEYYQGLEIDYPKDAAGRIAIGTGFRKITPSEKGFSYLPKMWLTRVSVQGPDGRVLNAELRVNKPFRTGGLTLYQMGFEQKAELLVTRIRDVMRPLPGQGNDVERLITAETNVPFEVEGERGRFMLGSLRLGTLFRKDGSAERIHPFAKVYYLPDEKPSHRETLGEISLGSSLDTKGITFTFREYEEASYVSYRKDPGVWLVGIACLFVFLGLFVRSLGAWYRVQYAGEGDVFHVLISSRGILADRDRIIRMLRK